MAIILSDLLQVSVSVGTLYSIYIDSLENHSDELESETGVGENQAYKIKYQQPTVTNILSARIQKQSSLVIDVHDVKLAIPVGITANAK